MIMRFLHNRVKIIMKGESFYFLIFYITYSVDAIKNVCFCLKYMCMNIISKVEGGLPMGEIVTTTQRYMLLFYRKVTGWHFFSSHHLCYFFIKLVVCIPYKYGTCIGSQSYLVLFTV